MSDPLLRIPDDSLNPTLNNLLHKIEKLVILSFGVVVTTSDAYFLGPGSGRHFPIPWAGSCLGLSVFDGTIVRSKTTVLGINTFVADDKIALFAQYDAPWFLVIVQKNGATLGTCYVTQVSASASLTGTIYLKIKIPYA